MKIAIVWIVLVLLLFFLGENKAVNSEYLHELQLAIDSAPYSPKDYKRNTFDCSNMSNLLDDWLELQGYDTKLVAFTMTKPDGSRASHMMVLVDDTVMVEATQKEIQVLRKIPDGAIIMSDSEDIIPIVGWAWWHREMDYSNNPYN